MVEVACGETTTIPLACIESFRIDNSFAPPADPTSAPPVMQLAAPGMPDTANSRPAVSIVPLGAFAGNGKGQPWGALPLSRIHKLARGAWSRYSLCKQDGNPSVACDVQADRLIFCLDAIRDDEVDTIGTRLLEVLGA